MAKAARKKPTARERGYAPKSEIAATLRDMAGRVDNASDNILIKFSFNFWYTEDDQLPAKEDSPDETDNR